MELPLATAPFVTAIADPLLAAGAPVGTFMAKSGLPESTLESPDSVVSELALWEFEEIAARSEGFDNLGYVSALSQADADSGRFCGLKLPVSPSVEGTLKLVSRWITSQSNYASHSLTREGNGAWYRFDNRQITDVLPWQVEQFVVGMVVAIVRMSQPGWIPQGLMLTNAKGISAVHEDWRFARKFWSQPRTGVHIDDATLVASTNLSGTVSPDIRCDVRSNDVLLDVFRNHILSGSASLSDLARSFKLHPRSFQRALAERGCRFRDLKTAAAMTLAQEMLTNPEAKACEVSERLGYSDPADFSKAFAKSIGVPPGRFQATSEPRFGN